MPPGGHHVGQYAGERKSDGALRVRGGNQSDAVTETWIARTRLMKGTAGVRWPSTYPTPDTGRVFLAGNGTPLSTNEA